MSLRRHVVGGLAVLAILATAMPAAGHHEPVEYRRAYLLADSGNFEWWSFDPLEPDADVRTVRRRGCPGFVPRSTELACPTDQLFTTFKQRSRLAQPASWSSQDPLRFRLAMEVDGATTSYTVHLTYEALPATASVTSPPAQEVAPGVWEGTLGEGGALRPGEVGFFGVLVLFDTDAPGTMRLRTDGSSWVELPQPVAGWSLSDLVRLSPDDPLPSVWETEAKRFRFNDDAWEVASFEGDLSSVRRFAHQLDEPVTAVVGWMEAYREPFTYQVVRRGAVDPARAVEFPMVRLLLDGEELERGAGVGGGVETVAAVDVGPGTLELEVRSSDAPVEPLEYRAHILVIRGERTLHSMRFEFSPMAAARVPFAAACADVAEPIPVGPLVTAFRVDLDWDSVAPATKWTPSYRIGPRQFPCGELGTGARMSFVLPGGDVFWVGATPARDAMFASARDTIIEAEVRFFHEPPPHPDEEDDQGST